MGGCEEWMRCGADDRTIRGHPVRGCLGDGARRPPGAPLPRRPACYAIQQGDTAAIVSWRMTGSAQQEYQPWFQILDAHSRVVPKSQYRWIHAGWRACIPWSRLGVAWNREQPFDNGK